MDSAKEEDQDRASADEFGTNVVLAIVVLFCIAESIVDLSSLRAFFTRPQPYSGSRMVNGELVSPDNSPGEPPVYGVVKQQLKTELQRDLQMPLAIRDLDLSEPRGGMLSLEGRHLQCWRYDFTLTERVDGGEMKLVRGYVWAKDNRLLTVAINPESKIP